MKHSTWLCASNKHRTTITTTVAKIVVDVSVSTRRYRHQRLYYSNGWNSVYTPLGPWNRSLVKSSISSRGSVSLAKNDFLSCRALTITFTWTTKRYGAWAPSESQAAGCTLFSHVLRAGTAGHPRRFRMYVVLVYVCAMYVCTLACMRADACYRCA